MPPCVIGVNCDGIVLVLGEEVDVDGSKGVSDVADGEVTVNNSTHPG